MQLGNVQVNFLQSLVLAIEDCQIDPWPLFAEFGLDDLLHSHPERRISIPRYMRLGHKAIELTQREDIGLLMGTNTQAHHFGLLGFCAQSAETLGQALGTLIEFEKLFSQNSRGHSQIIKTESHTGFQFYSISPYNSYNLFVVDAFFAGWINLLKIFVGEQKLNLSGARVEIEFDTPSYAPSYEFWGLPVLFSQDKNILWLPNSLCQQKNPLANPISYQQIRQICHQQLNKLKQGQNISQQVAELIAMKLTGQTPSLKDIASDLHMESWTLKRRLQDEGNLFKNLLDDTRNALATRYIRDTALSLGEISYLMGFSAPVAFQRAFKRWHGIAPGLYRQQAKLRH